MTVDTAPREVGLRRVPWGANVVRQTAGDPYVKGYDVVEGESALQAMTKAGLDWTVEIKQAFVAADEEEHFVGQPIDGYYATTRSDNGLPLSVVKGRYVPFQNRAMFEFVDTLVDTSESSLVGAVEVDQGRRVCAIVKLDEQIRPKNIPEEVVDVYLFAANHHTGRASFAASVFPMRLACVNGLRFTIKSLASSWKVRHTNGLKANIIEAQRALNLTITYAEQFEREVEQLFDQAITDKQFNQIVETMFPPPEDPEERKRLDTLQAARRDQVRHVYRESPDLQNIRGTAYGVVNAFAEWEQWVNPGLVRAKYGSREAALVVKATDAQSNQINATSNKVLQLVRNI